MRKILGVLEKAWKYGTREENEERREILEDKESAR